MSNFRWNPELDATVRSMSAAGATIRQIGNAIGVSDKAASRRRAKLGLATRPGSAGRPTQSIDAVVEGNAYRAMMRAGSTALCEAVVRLKLRDHLLKRAA